MWTRNAGKCGEFVNLISFRHYHLMKSMLSKLFSPEIKFKIRMNESDSKAVSLGHSCMFESSAIQFFGFKDFQQCNISFGFFSPKIPSVEVGLYMSVAHVLQHLFFKPIETYIYIRMIFERLLGIFLFFRYCFKLRVMNLGIIFTFRCWRCVMLNVFLVLRQIRCHNSYN